MKFFIFSLVLCWTWQSAWPQIKTGTVILVDFEKDQITISADSRSVQPQTGGYEDTECKISAFGDKFVFTLAGMVRETGTNGWDSHLIARNIWKSESAHETDAGKLARSVADKWVDAMDKIYGNPRIVSAKRRDQPDNNMFASGIFAATDKTGSLVVIDRDISFDISLFDSNGTVRLIHTPVDLVPGNISTGGLDEIIDEFKSQRTPRSEEFMRWWFPQILKLGTSERSAAMASKFIELSILLHPRNSDLGFPIDVLQIAPGTGVHWVSNAKNCPDMSGPTEAKDGKK